MMGIGFRSDGHLWWPGNSSYLDSLGLQSSRLTECIEVVQAEGLRGIFARVPYFTDRNVDFLGNLPDLEEVDFGGVELDDLEGLYQLPKLRSLSIGGKRPAIDFSRLQTLTRLSVVHRPKDHGFAKLSNLIDMGSSRYKPAQAAFDLALPVGLRKLDISWSPIETISTLGPLPELRDLHLARCRNLCDLGDLVANFPRLEYLTVEACGRLTRAEAERAISGHPALTRVIAANKIILGPKPPRMAPLRAVKES